MLTAGPFRYTTYSGTYVAAAKAHTGRPLKQAVIAPSAISLIYSQDGIDGYSRADFLADLVNECEKDIRSAFDAGADSVQIDFTERRLCCKLDPSRGLLRDFVALNNQVLARFSDAERARIGVHTCPGGDQDSTHSADVDYAELLPDLFAIDAGRFFVQMASEADRPRGWTSSRANDGPGRRSMSGSPIPSTHASRPPRRFASASWKRRSISARRGSVAPTIAASPRSATMCRPRARPHSPRSGPGSRARSSPKPASADHGKRDRPVHSDHRDRSEGIGTAAGDQAKEMGSTQRGSSLVGLLISVLTRWAVIASAR